MQKIAENLAQQRITSKTNSDHLFRLLLVDQAENFLFSFIGSFGIPLWLFLMISLNWHNSTVFVASIYNRHPFIMHDNVAFCLWKIQSFTNKTGRSLQDAGMSDGIYRLFTAHTT